MDCEVIEFSRSSFDGNATLRTKLNNVAVILKAIGAAELLEALPDCPVARDQHRTALTLLAIAESELNSLCMDLPE